MHVCLSCSQHFAGSWTCPACGYTPALHKGYLTFAPELADSNDQYAAAFFERLAALEDGHFWFEARNRLLIRALRRHFPQAQTLLEIGCGTGFVLRGLRQAAPHLRLFGADLYSDSLNFAARRAPDADLFQMDARAIPFAAAFDVVGAFDVIEHIEEDTAVLAQMHRSLRPGGGLMLTVPQHPALWSIMDTISYHKRRYTRRELVAKVEAAGFEVDYVTSFVMLLLPAMLLARLIRHRRRAQFNPLAEFTINPALNRLLAAVMALEGGLLQAGMRFPAGGSLLLVAHKR